MKNLILCFLVFITTFLNAQSVDPETFPTVVGAISNKNVYTNTGGEGKISVQSIIDSAKLISGDFIPLSGTEVGKPVTGDVEVEQYGSRLFKTLNDNGDAYNSVVFDASGIIITGRNSPTTETNIQITDFEGKCLLTTNSPTPRGYSSLVDCTPYIGDLDYTQKIYVDTKVAKIGADDIEITDFNKGIILTSPNSSRYRITVDNAGNLITTLIP